MSDTVTIPRAMAYEMRDLLYRADFTYFHTAAKRIEMNSRAGAVLKAFTAALATQSEPVSADVEWPAQTGKLPERMEHCTILFKQCERGHGQLTATNWVPQPCLVCEVQKLRALIGDDAYAASFQSLSQYRNALLRELKKRLTI
jgi:hypothetical protein